MTVIQSAALIARPIEEVFDFAVDSRNEFEWNPRVNGGPIAVTLSVTLSEEAAGTRLRSRFDARPHGLVRLFFPAFVYVMRKEEARNMTLLKTHLETRVPR